MTVKHYPYTGGNFDYIVFDGDGTVWVRKDTLGAGTCHRIRGHRSYRTQGGYRIECSECGYGLADRRYHYCPNCGRRIMEVGE